MSFTAYDAPKVGEVSRCKRCSTTFITRRCPCDGVDCGVVMFPAGHIESGINETIGARLVADRSCEFCPTCWTPEERGALALKATAQAKGTAGN